MFGSWLNAKDVKRVMFVISNITFGICLDEETYADEQYLARCCLRSHETFILYHFFDIV